MFEAPSPDQARCIPFLPPPALPCLPPPWAKGPHAQTLLGMLVRAPDANLDWTRVRLDLGDGDALALRCLGGTSGVVVSLFHGVAGSADEPYMVRVAAALHGRGHAVVAVNQRGQGEGRDWARRPCHFGSTADLAAVLGWVRHRFPDHRRAAVGFSQGASLLLLLLGRGEAPDGLAAAVAVNPPADLDRCSRRLLAGFNRAYDRYFLDLLRRRWLADQPELRLDSLRALDAAFTAPCAGYASLDAYYADCSCGPRLEGIRVPTVILTAADDPVAAGTDFLEWPRSPAVHLHLEAHGGHLGYLSANVAGYRWLEYALVHDLEALLAL